MRAYLPVIRGMEQTSVLAGFHLFLLIMTHRIVVLCQKELELSEFDLDVCSPLNMQREHREYTVSNEMIYVPKRVWRYIHGNVFCPKNYVISKVWISIITIDRHDHLYCVLIDLVQES